MSKIPDFGDYVSIEMHRYGAQNEFYTHKVVGNHRSNSWQDVPLVATEGARIHQGDMQTVLSVIQAGINETIVFNVLASDCKLKMDGAWDE